MLSLGNFHHHKKQEIFLLEIFLLIQKVSDGKSGSGKTTIIESVCGLRKLNLVKLLLII